jgi:hypothetical protein
MKKSLIIIALLTLTSCERLHDWKYKPIYLSELTQGGFFFEWQGSWSYVELHVDSTFYQVVYDIEKDSVFKLEGIIPHPPPLAITFEPFYVLKNEGKGYKKTEKQRSRMYTIYRGVWYKYYFFVNVDYDLYYNYVRRKPYKVKFKESYDRVKSIKVDTSYFVPWLKK